MQEDGYRNVNCGIGHGTYFREWYFQGDTIRNAETDNVLDCTGRKVYMHDANDGNYQNWEKIT